MFFGFKRRDSVTQILFDLGLPSFNTIMHNSKVVLVKVFVVAPVLLSGILIVYCRLCADCIMIMLSVSVSVSVYLLSLHILLFLWALSPELKRMWMCVCVCVCVFVLILFCATLPLYFLRACLCAVTFC